MNSCRSLLLRAVAEAAGDIGYVGMWLKMEQGLLWYAVICVVHLLPCYHLCNLPHAGRVHLKLVEAYKAGD